MMEEAASVRGWFQHFLAIESLHTEWLPTWEEKVEP